MAPSEYSRRPHLLVDASALIHSSRDTQNCTQPVVDTMDTFEIAMPVPAEDSTTSTEGEEVFADRERFSGSSSNHSSCIIS
ncbi:hypothetical protein C8Q80DRAFT_328959 [Daedaleopsis nitida]|nr:hypothetical protein C8Q80DRAFT_328959 [Daedaleopsis nitida]